MHQLITKFFSILFLIFVVHKYYVSTTLIDLDEESNYFEITIKTFYDDLETELKLSNIDYEIQYDQINELYEEYLLAKFILTSNDNEIKYEYLGFEKRNDTYPQLTDHYFTGDYPVKPIDELGDDKITQLSLLSTASNN